MQNAILDNNIPRQDLGPTDKYLAVGTNDDRETRPGQGIVRRIVLEQGRVTREIHEDLRLDGRREFDVGPPAGGILQGAVLGREDSQSGCVVEGLEEFGPFQGRFEDAVSDCWEGVGDGIRQG